MKIGFDKVFCISYCRNVDKQNDIRKVMKYLGIDFEFIYGADYTNMKAFKEPDFYFRNGPNELKEKKFDYFTHFIGASYDHYTAIINAYESGANSVLIFEDDCKFINDVKYIEYYLNHWPEYGEFIKFGYHNWCYMKNRDEIIDLMKKNKYGGYLKNSSEDLSLDFVGSQMYGLTNRSVMRRYIRNQQEDFACCDGMHFQFKCYCLVKPIAVDPLMIWEEEDLKTYNLLENINDKKTKLINIKKLFNIKKNI